MNKVILVKSEQEYLIVDNNDERLFVLAELLRNNEARHIAHLELANPGVTKGQAKNFVIEHDEKNAYIKLYYVHEAITKPGKPLTIDMPLDQLRNCIEQWNKLIKQKPRLIILTREADVFKLQASKE